VFGAARIPASASPDLVFAAKDSLLEIMYLGSVLKAEGRNIVAALIAEDNHD
jgi:hypothetical protein